MEFNTFYQYFLFTKSWAYVMMFVVLPVYVLYWNFVLFPDKKRPLQRLQTLSLKSTRLRGHDRKVLPLFLLAVDKQISQTISTYYFN